MLLLIEAGGVRESSWKIYPQALSPSNGHQCLPRNEETSVSQALKGNFVISTN